MVLFVSQELSEYIKEKYNIDLSKDDNISNKKYNPHCCLARVWKSEPEYTFNAGGFTNFQCNNPNLNNCEFCECHQEKFNKNDLTLGKIYEEPPEELVIKDIDGNLTRYYWIHQSEDMLKEKIFLKAEEEKQKEYSERRGRGRPTTKKILYKNIDWNKLYEEDKINTIPLPSLKEYLSNHKLNFYGKKNELIERIKENIRNN